MPFNLPDPVDTVRSILLESMELDQLRAVRAARLARYRSERAVVSEALRPLDDGANVVPIRPRLSS